jgi:hypothetical protein
MICTKCGEAMDPVKGGYFVTRVEQRIADLEAEIKRLGMAIAEFVVEMDKTMRGGSSYERGLAIARLVSALQRAIDPPKLDKPN